MHPADMVVEAFKDAAAAKETVRKMRTFLEDTLKVHGMKLDAAMPPEPWKKTDYFYPINKISCFSMGNLWVTCGKKSRLHQYLTFWASTKWGCECCEGGTSQCFSAHQPHQSENSRRWTSLRVRLDHMLYFIHLQWISFREGTHWFELGRATSGRSGRCTVGHQERVYPFALGIYWAFFVFFFREVNCFYFRRCPLNELCSYTRTCPLLLTLIASDLDPVAGKEMLGKNIRWFGAWGKTLELEIVLEKNICLPGPDSAVDSCDQGLVWDSWLFERPQRHGYYQLWSYPVEHPRFRTPKKRCSLLHLFMNIFQLVFAHVIFWIL